VIIIMRREERTRENRRKMENKEGKGTEIRV
jgi:hypothetical protein